ncbi:MAG: CoA transferase subunit A, partial [Myxococcaceae bacterium]
MNRARWCSLSEAVASIPNGAWLAAGGFMLGRAPMALVLELVAQEKRDLQLISLPNPLPAEFLVAGGCARRVEFPFGALVLENRVRPLPCL